MLIKLKYDELNIDKTFSNKIHEIRNKENCDIVMSIHDDDVNLINSLILAARPKIIVETGTNVGLSTLVLAYHDFVEKVITHDLPEGDNIGRSVEFKNTGIAFRNALFENKIEKRFVRTTDLTELPVADFYFFDSGHTYNVISHEFQLAEKAIKNNNKSPLFFVFHDYNLDRFPDVGNFVNNLSKNMDNIFYGIDTKCGIAYVQMK